MLLQIETAISNYENCYYKMGEVLQTTAVTTNWGITLIPCFLLSQKPKPLWKVTSRLKVDINATSLFLKTCFLCSLLTPWQKRSQLVKQILSFITQQKRNDEMRRNIWGSNQINYWNLQGWNLFSHDLQKNRIIIEKKKFPPTINLLKTNKSLLSRTK